MSIISYLFPGLLVQLWALQDVVAQGGPYFDGYSVPWNDTEEGERAVGGTLHTSNSPRRNVPQHGLGYPEGKKAKAWTVQMREGDPDEAPRAPPAAPQSRPGVLNRRFPSSSKGTAGRGAVPEPPRSCPGGVCPNPDMYDDEDLQGEPYDLPYDPACEAMFGTWHPTLVQPGISGSLFGLRAGADLLCDNAARPAPAVGFRGR